MSDESGARQKQLQVLGAHVEAVSLAIMGHRNLEVDIIGLSVRGPRTEDEEILLTVRGLSSDGTPVVTFLSGPSLGGLLVSLDSGLNAGKLKWRPDEYRT